MRRYYFNSLSLAATCLSVTLGAPCLCALNVSTNIAGDTRWTLADSPVEILASGFVVEEGATLTIDPGVIVKVSDSFTVNGRLKAVGAMTNRIVFDELAPDSKWGYLKFSRQTWDSLSTNEILHCDLRNMGSYIYVSQQSAVFEDCAIAITGDIPYGIHGYVNTGVAVTASARFTMISNTISVFTTRQNPGSSAYGISLDGFPSEMIGNTFTLTSTGSLYNFIGINLDKSNTKPYNTVLSGNNISVSSHHQDPVNTYGIKYNSAVSGPMSNNTLTVSGPQSVYGILKYDDGVTAENRISVISSSGASFGYLWGIRSDCTSAGDNDIIVNNMVSVSNDYNIRYLTGIQCEEGRVRGNRVTGAHNAITGSLSGIVQIYYPGYIEGNSISLNAAGGIYLNGIYLTTHYNTSHVVTVRNNILVGNGLTNSAGVYQDIGFSAVLSNSYNLAYNFFTNYEGCSAGDGALATNPLFVDADMRLAKNSPAIDAGVNIAWQWNAVDMDGNPRIDNLLVDVGADEYMHPPAAVNITLTNQTAASTWSVVSGALYQAQTCSNLLNPAWTNLGAVVTAADTLITFEDTNVIQNLRFYRAIRLLSQ